MIDSGETKEAIFTINIDNDTPTGTSIDLAFEVVAGAYASQQSFYLPVGLVFEDFETGDFSAFEWDFAGDADWTITSSGPYEGMYSAKSGAIGDESESELIVTMDIVADDEISFFRKVSSEANYDYLRFYIDGVQKSEWAGEENWDSFSYPVTGGTHTFKWSYEKDDSVASGEDCAWIDYIVFPGVATPPVSVNEHLAVGFNVFPNPVRDLFSIEYQLSSSSKVSVSLVNQLGQEMMGLLQSDYQDAGYHKFDYNISNLEPGIYLIRISTEFSNITKKIIISK